MTEHVRWNQESSLSYTIVPVLYLVRGEGVGGDTSCIFWQGCATEFLNPWPYSAKCIMMKLDQPKEKHSRPQPKVHHHINVQFQKKIHRKEGHWKFQGGGGS